MLLNNAATIGKIKQEYKANVDGFINSSTIIKLNNINTRFRINPTKNLLSKTVLKLIGNDLIL